MNDAMSNLLVAVEKERARLREEITKTEALLFQQKDELKRHDRVLNAAGITPNGDEPKPTDTKKRKNRNNSAHGRIGPERIEQVYQHMAAMEAQVPGSEHTTKSVAVAVGVSTVSASAALKVLHEQGRTRLLRKQGPKFVWGVV